MSEAMEKMTPYSDEWIRLAYRMARDYCPTIYPCADCGAPVIKGYCCTTCGSDNPEGAK